MWLGNNEEEQLQFLFSKRLVGERSDLKKEFRKAECESLTIFFLL